MNDVGPMKKFKNKKLMWDFIALNSSNPSWKVDGPQCETG